LAGVLTSLSPALDSSTASLARLEARSSLSLLVRRVRAAAAAIGGWVSHVSQRVGMGVLSKHGEKIWRWVLKKDYRRWVQVLLNSCEMRKAWDDGDEGMGKI